MKKTCIVGGSLLFLAMPTVSLAGGKVKEINQILAPRGEGQVFLASAIFTSKQSWPASEADSSSLGKAKTVKLELRFKTVSSENKPYKGFTDMDYEMVPVLIGDNSAELEGENSYYVRQNKDKRTQYFVWNCDTTSNCAEKPNGTMDLVVRNGNEVEMTFSSVDFLNEFGVKEVLSAKKAVFVFKK